MSSFKKFCLAQVCVLSSLLFAGLSTTQLLGERHDKNLVWCTVNTDELKACEKLAFTLNVDQYDDYNRLIDTYRLNCTQAYNKDECMIMIDNNQADLTSLDPGELFLGGRYHSLVPIAEELYKNDADRSPEASAYAVAVVKRTSTISSLRDLRGKGACFGGVGTFAGWVTPIHKLMERGGMEIIDCNNHVKSALEYFGQSCAVNSLSDKYNPLGDNSHKLCEICGSDLPGIRCTSNDPYAGYEGALSCLMDSGDIAFVKHSTIREYFEQIQREQLIRPPPDNQGFYDSNTYGRDNTGSGRSFLDFPNTSPVPTDIFGRPISTTVATDLFGRPITSTTTTTTRRPRFPFDSNNNDNNNNNQFGQPGSTYNTNTVRGRGNNFYNNESRTSPDGFNTGFRTAPVPDNRNKGLRTLQEFQQEYELLCPDGRREHVNAWRACYWERIPSHVVVTSSAKNSRTRRDFQRFLQNMFRQFKERLFDVMRVSNRSNVLFQDAAVDLRNVPEQEQTYTKYLGDNMKAIMDIRSCPVGRVTLCVTSKPELHKCVKMRTALNAQLLKPEMSCYEAPSHVDCMKAIRKGHADFAVFDAGDVYTGGYHYQLIPIMSEIYNTRSMELGQPEYYAVAVAYQGDPDTELTYLKGKYSCHSGIGHGAGWTLPIAYLISSGRMRNYGCDAVMAASQYFTKSCVPGALRSDYNYGQYQNNLCDLCRGSSNSYCRRDASEDFYGYTGAFRCLIEGGGQVAFVKHTTVSEITDGKRRETWARNTLSGDYELLCRDGTRAPVTDYQRCNLGKVKANAVVVRGEPGYNETTTKAIINLLLYSQQLYGRKLEDDFSFGMFYSPPPYSDLIFQDAAQQLQVVPKEERNYRDYLGKNFLKARALVDCYARCSNLVSSKSLLLLVIFSWPVHAVWL